MSEYIVGFWPHLQEAVDLMESLSSVEDVSELNTGTAIFMKRALNLEIMNRSCLFKDVDNLVVSSECLQIYEMQTFHCLIFLLQFYFIAPLFYLLNIFANRLI